MWWRRCNPRPSQIVLASSCLVGRGLPGPVREWSPVRCRACRLDIRRNSAPVSDDIASGSRDELLVGSLCQDEETGMTAVCEIPIAGGRTCGIAAQCRCSRCERAYCLSHANMLWDGTPSLSLCAPCRDESDEAKRQAWTQRQEQKKQQEQQVQADAARLPELARAAARSLAMRHAPTYRAAILGYRSDPKIPNPTRRPYIKRDLGRMWAICIKDRAIVGEDDLTVWRSAPQWAGLDVQGKLWSAEEHRGIGSGPIEEVRPWLFGRREPVLLIQRATPLDWASVFKPDQTEDWTKLISKFESLTDKGEPDLPGRP